MFSKTVDRSRTHGIIITAKSILSPISPPPTYEYAAKLCIPIQCYPLDATRYRKGVVADNFPYKPDLSN